MRPPAGTGIGRICRWMIILVLLTTTGCSSTHTLTAPDFSPGSSKHPTVLLMPLDVTMAQITMGGLPEPKGDWTVAAQANVAAALDRQLASMGLDIVPYENRGTLDRTERQLLKLHEAIGDSILEYDLKGDGPPSKNGELDYTLGATAQLLRDRYGADYALFVFAEDTLSSTGRVLSTILFAAITGYVRDGGRTASFASLVDLRTGKIAWFNHAERSVGDLRDPESAAITVDSLLEGFPVDRGEG